MTEKKPNSTTSLRARLGLWLGGLFLAGMVSLYYVAKLNADAAADRSFDRILLGSALSISETISVTSNGIDVNLPYAALDMLSAAPDDRVFYTVVAPDGEVVTGNTDLPTQESPQSPKKANYFDANYKGEQVRFVIIGRDVTRPNTLGWIRVQVGQTRIARKQMSRELVLNMLLPISLMTILVLIFVWVAISKALFPLSLIGKELASRRPNELTPITGQVPTDLAPLVDPLNKFMHRLSDNIEALRSFIAEAAHQMRTPLAALRAQAQAAEGDSPEELRETLAAIERNAGKLTRLLNQLLSDSTVTHRSDLHKFNDFNLRRTIRQCMEEVIPTDIKDICIFDTPLKEASFYGDAIMIGEAVKNLIHNALYHGNGSQDGIIVTFNLIEGNFVISVFDHGDGLGGVDAETLFARFTRTKKHSSGFGLGLPIVRRVVRNHDGQVDLKDREGGGLIATIKLPTKNV